MFLAPLFHPQSPQVQAIATLFIYLLILAAIVFVMVSGLVTYSVIRYSARGRTGEPPQRMGSAHPLSAPYQAFRAADGHVVIGAGSQPLFRRLCDLLGLDALVNDPRFEDQARRMQAYRELAALIEAQTAQVPAAELLARLEAAGIPA